MTTSECHQRIKLLREAYERMAKELDQMADANLAFFHQEFKSVRDRLKEADKNPVKVVRRKRAAKGPSPLPASINMSQSSASHGKATPGEQGSRETMVLQNLYIRRQSKLDEVGNRISSEAPNPGATRGSHLTSISKAGASRESVRTSPTPSPYKISSPVEQMEDEEEIASYSQAKPTSRGPSPRLEEVASLDTSSKSDGMCD